MLLLTITAYGQQRLRVSILGDSYSTYQNYIPEGNEPWYFEPFRPDMTDVKDVRQTWWWQVVHDGGFILEKNDSYSGSTICYTGYNDDDYSPRSFITRLPRLGSPDIILIFGNTNDSWCGAKLGEYQYGDWKRADLYTYRPALAKLLNDAQKNSGCVLVDIGADTTTVSIYKSKLLRFLSVIPLGSDNITKDIMSLQMEHSDA
jgi:hypothetical protein